MPTNIYNGLAGGRWNSMKIAQIVALPYRRVGVEEFFLLTPTPLIWRGVVCDIFLFSVKSEFYERCYI